MPSEDYVQVKKIGQGAFGIAYICDNKADGKRYVLKKVRLARQSAKERQASIKELLLLSSVHHRNILRYKESWVEAGCVVCMVVELCESGDLFTQLQLRSNAQLFFKELHLKEMLVQLASSLDFLHKNNIAHRDVKSSNIFITDIGCLRLADFGLATMLDADSPLSKTVVGTPNYMCPELLQDKPYGVKNDIWALGCVMFELSALRPAFRAFNMEGLVKKITAGPTPNLPSHYSEDWKNVVRAMLNKDEDKRPTAEEILMLPFLQESKLSVEAQFGPAIPPGAQEAVLIQDLPPDVAKLDDQLKQQEVDAQRKAAEDDARRKELKAKYAPKAFRPQAEREKEEALALAARMKAARATPVAAPRPGPAGSRKTSATPTGAAAAATKGKATIQPRPIPSPIAIPDAHGGRKVASETGEPFEGSADDVQERASSAPADSPIAAHVAALELSREASASMSTALPSRYSAPDPCSHSSSCDSSHVNTPWSEGAHASAMLDPCGNPETLPHDRGLPRSQTETGMRRSSHDEEVASVGRSASLGRAPVPSVQAGSVAASRASAAAAGKLPPKPVAGLPAVKPVARASMPSLAAAKATVSVTPVRCQSSASKGELTQLQTGKTAEAPAAVDSKPMARKAP
mmetsp:Transcript_37144/g.82632  ORF Transcript_37144/g.82632 Transcript_37144/m.82632 type:complete len:632 (+) Transcript_37144:231-2126(+)|eukprot:CAMPEP_0202923958 /NCGR_PEP_ID=MMETSP1392-20130828/78719_1 /ASSEMBLY_ACC=CAM_ASM_000868 /TAXON_ID=225041 /ORGANISM="Chlamydomonas chlamydogama, Strain SAG 11-48b" /LENGTH=631 /DNA_ID=CAMNT_0049617661 /DNA_START=205 /DNA_END=2100 /DNA_ORIENTATION=+